jgi:hypothetical protein
MVIQHHETAAETERGWDSHGKNRRRFAAKGKEKRVKESKNKG